MLYIFIFLMGQAKLAKKRGKVLTYLIYYRWSRWKEDCCQRTSWVTESSLRDGLLARSRQSYSCPHHWQVQVRPEVQLERENNAEYDDNNHHGLIYHANKVPPFSLIVSWRSFRTPGSLFQPTCSSSLMCLQFQDRLFRHKTK